jgi:trimeric autotransporter adhesin
MCSRKWLIVALVVCGLSTACQDYNTNLSVQTASSLLTFISPSSGYVGSQGFTITANGQGFSTGAEILWNGVPLNTTLVSSIQLTAPVPASDLTNTGTVQVAVEIPNSAQSPTQNVNTTVTTAISNVMLFTVSAAPGTPPSLMSLSPNSAPFCGNTTGFPITVTGAGFTSDSILNWNGSPRATTVTDVNHVTATILASDTVVPSPALVTVSNSGGTSNSLQFTISNNTPNLPPPALAFYAGDNTKTPPIPPSPRPTTEPVGSSAVSLEIDARQSPATSFSACSVVQWVAGAAVTSLPTLYTSTPNSTTGSPAYLTTTIPASLLSAAGTANIQIFTPGPGGGPSAQVPFTIAQQPPPNISSVFVSGSSATSTLSCAPASVILQVNGTNFFPTSVVNWNGSPRPTTFVQPPPPAVGQPAPAAYLTVAIPYTDTLLPASGTATITASNGSAVSNTVSFSVVAPSSLPVPSVSAIAPSSAMVGSGPFTLIVTGTGFVPCSFVQWGGASRATTTKYLSPTQLSVPVSAGDLVSPGTVAVTVSTPAPSGCTPSATIMCGGTSSATAATTFTISGLSIGAVSVLGSSPPAASTPYCSPTGFTLDVTPATGTTFTSDTVVNWNGSPRPTTFVSATELQAAITYADTAFQGSVSVTVSNSESTSAAASFSLSAPTSLPVPSINSLSPSHTAAGGPGFTLSVTGSGLLPCSTVQWKSSGSTTTTIFTTTFTSVNGLTAAISAADISMAGIEQVTVNTPPPSGCTAGTGITCGGTSNSETFTVYTPVAGAVRTAAMIQPADIAGSGARSAPLLSLHLMSADQRYAVHVLASTDGVTEIPGTTQNIFVRDTCAGAPSGCVPSEKLVSIGVGGNLADGGSFSPSISSHGRYMAFLSSARNLVDDDTNGEVDVFVRDTCAGAAAGCTPSTQRVSLASDGIEADGSSTSATIDATGRYVTFESAATNLGSSSSSPSAPGLFLRDTCAGTNAACTPSTQPTR